MSSKHSAEKDLTRAAFTQYGAGNFPKAEILYRKVLAAYPENIDALNGLGLIALRFNHLDTAKRLFEKALKLSPQRGEIHQHLGYVYATQNNYERAIACFIEALKCDPDDRQIISDINKAKKELRIARDPDYSIMPAAPWTETDWAWEDKQNNSTLMVLFAGLGVGDKPPTFIFANFLKAYPQVDKLFLRDLNKHWYLNGLGDISNNVEETTEYLKKKIAGYERVIFMGCSAGGMAALLYGELIEPDKVLAFAPQTVLTEVKEKELGDMRWFDAMIKLRDDMGGSKYMDLENLNSFAADIDIHYSAGCEVDCLHARRIVGPNVSKFPHEGDEGHLIALHLRDNGKLKALVEHEIN